MENFSLQLDLTTLLGVSTSASAKASVSTLTNNQADTLADVPVRAPPSLQLKASHSDNQGLGFKDLVPAAPVSSTPSTPQKMSHSQPFEAAGVLLGGFRTPPRLQSPVDLSTTSPQMKILAFDDATVGYPTAKNCGICQCGGLSVSSPVTVWRCSLKYII